MSDITGIIVAIMVAALIVAFMFDMFSKEKSIRKIQDENTKLIKERDMYKARYDLLSEKIAKCLIDLRVDTKSFEEQMASAKSKLQEVIDEQQ